MDAFDSLDKLCEEYQIAIAIHPHGPSGGKNRHQWWSAEVIMKAVKDHHTVVIVWQEENLTMESQVVSAEGDAAEVPQFSYGEAKLTLDVQDVMRN